MIGIIDYGLGNLGSLKAATLKVGGVPIISSDPKILSTCTHLILGGVGAFPDGMRNLRERNLIVFLNEVVAQGKVPLLGICLGFQLLAKSSTEFGLTSGLGYIEGIVEKINATGLPVPHIGWNECNIQQDDQIFRGISQPPLFYFVHSYHMVCNEKDLVVATAEYGVEIISGIRKNNIYGFQFHPKKAKLVA